ncbi:MAG: hypothetical protein ACRYFZ_19430 [Janthinobacterium lividum]
MKAQFSPGQRVLVVGKHPHAGRFATLLSYGPYGLKEFNFEGWHARSDDSLEFYCQDKNLAALDEQPPFEVDKKPKKAKPVPAVEVVEVVEVVEAVEEPASTALTPTISPGRRETTLDKLRAHFKAADTTKPVVLSKHQQEVLTRLDAAWSLLLAKKPEEKTVTKLMSRFGISRAQAYRDLGDSKNLYGDVVKSNREADRYLLKEMAMETYSLSKKAGEFKEMNKAVDNLIKITGIQKDDANIPDAEAFLPSNYVLELKNNTGRELTLNLETIAQLPAHEFEEAMNLIQETGGVSEFEMLQKIMEAARGTVE